MFTRSVLISVSLLALAAVASAVPYKVTFSGVVDYLDDSNGLFAGDSRFAVGSVLSASYLIDPDAMDGSPDDATFGQFDVQFHWLGLNHSSVSTLLPLGTTTEYVYDNSGSDEVNLHGTTMDEEYNVYFLGKSLLSSDQQPDFSTLLGKSSQAYMGYLYSPYINGTTYYAEIAAPITSVTVEAVPEPASIAALGLGAVALLRRRRK